MNYMYGRQQGNEREKQMPFLHALWNDELRITNYELYVWEATRKRKRKTNAFSIC